MCRFTIILLSFLVNKQAVLSANVDQRQTGDLNVQIDLKNLQIVGLMKGKEEYVDYDYAYDYSEMTIKPPSGTNKPLNVTESPVNKDNTTDATVLAELDQSTISIENNSSLPETTVASTQMIVANESSTIVNTSTTQGSIESTSPTSADCKKGFFRNSKGNCELKLQNPSNALLKMIKQKLKISSSKGVSPL